jgi:hypothetical protein
MAYCDHFPVVGAYPAKLAIPMRFDASAYGPEVARILALGGNGNRLMPLAHGQCSSEEARQLLEGRPAAAIFPSARAPEAALSGLWLYYSCLEESHRLSQEIHTPDGSFWHGIMHRQEPDAGNSAYWFRRVGRHPVFEPLLGEARVILADYPDVDLQPGTGWDPFAFIDFCEAARRKPGSEAEQCALRIQLAEWQLLFHNCASPRS